MSLLQLNRNLNSTLTKLKVLNDRKLLLSNFIQISASYSRRSNSKDSNSPYKVVKAKILDRSKDNVYGEGGPNWELLAPKGNRFYLPNFAGPAWQNAKTIGVGQAHIQDLIDFDSKSKTKLHITTKECPMLLRSNLQELFPAPEVISETKLCLITLTSHLENAEPGAKNFVLAAKEICVKLRLNGFWADFMNPFSGKPFHSYSSGKKLYKIDNRFRGLGIRFETLNNCVIMAEDDTASFTGNVFTNGPMDITDLKTMFIDTDL